GCPGRSTTYSPRNASRRLRRSTGGSSRRPLRTAPVSTRRPRRPCRRCSASRRSRCRRPRTSSTRASTGRSTRVSTWSARATRCCGPATTSPRAPRPSPRRGGRSSRAGDRPVKSAPFAYVRPVTVEQACAELAADDDSKVLSGGQSLVPVLAMRLARPSTLVDINAVAGLDELGVVGGRLRVGATVRQRRVERDELASRVPLLHKALPWVGHRELRSRGTVCGSLAHADPAAELPAVACCLDAEV